MPITDALVTLRDRLVDSPLALEVAGVGAARATREGLVGQVEDYLLPRLRSIDAPLLVVVGGSTGAGKSTLVNTLVGAEVSAAGVLRPTTRSPVLVCAPDDLAAFAATDRVLPGLARSTGPGPVDGSALRLVPVPALPPGLALLDAPDIDSVVRANRELAAALLAAADLWLFVTTAARYADAVPWDLLRQASERSTALAVVLDRVPPEAGTEVAAHLGAMLAEQGLGRARLFVLPEAELVDGRLPEAAVAEVRSWLTGLAADAGARAGVVRSTLEGALDSVPARVEQVAAALDAQAATAAALRHDVGGAFAAARREVAEGVAGGALLRGEVLQRWLEFVGTGELMRSLQTGIGRLRDRLKSFVTGSPDVPAEVEAAVGSGIGSLVLAAADRAAERAVDSWSSSPAGRAVLDAAGPEVRRLGRASSALAPATTDSVRAWQGHVLELVGAEGAGKRTAARALSFGVNGAGVALMLVVFAQTGGLTGAEAAVAGGTAAASQKLLEALFGDQAVRSLTVAAREDLLARVDHLLDGEAARFEALLAGRAPDAGVADGLRSASAAVQAAR